jgi:hypothetical protein
MKPAKTFSETMAGPIVIMIDARIGRVAWRLCDNISFASSLANWMTKVSSPNFEIHEFYSRGLNERD